MNEWYTQSYTQTLTDTFLHILILWLYENQVRYDDNTEMSINHRERTAARAAGDGKRWVGTSRRSSSSSWRLSTPVNKCVLSGRRPSAHTAHSLAPFLAKFWAEGQMTWRDSCSLLLASGLQGRWCCNFGRLFRCFAKNGRISEPVFSAHTLLHSVVLEGHTLERVTNVCYRELFHF